MGKAKFIILDDSNLQGVHEASLEILRKPVVCGMM